MTDAEYTTRIAQLVTEACEAGLTEFEDIVRKCRGAYPTDVMRALSECTSKNIVYRPQQPTRPNESPETIVDLEGNPVLYAWLFSDKTCKYLADLDSWEGKRIAFLGAPRLYEWFAENGLGGDRIVLDADATVLELLRKRWKNQGETFVHYNANDPVPDNLSGPFDIVFMDPPWHSEDYLAWFNRAFALCPHGQVITVLFQELTRPTAPEEISAITDFLRCVGSKYVLRDAVVEYDIPSFELAELLASRVLVSQPWRLADLLIAESPSGRFTLRESEGRSQPAWHEVSIEGLRWFVNTSVEAPHTGLLALPDGWKLVLTTPDRRDGQRANANVRTSRGHALMTGDPWGLLLALRELKHAFKTARSRGGAYGQAGFSAKEASLLHAIGIV